MQVDKNWADKHFGEKDQGNKSPSKQPPPKKSRTGLLVSLLILGAITGVTVWQFDAIRTHVTSWFSEVETDMFSAEPEAEPASLSLFGPADETAEPQYDAKSQRKIESLNNGIAMRSKEITKIETEIARLETHFNLRNRGSRRKPWSSAETIDEANMYLRRSGLSQEQVFSAKNAIRDAQATLTNARRRIDELVDLKDAKEKWIGRMQADLKALQAP